MKIEKRIATKQEVKDAVEIKKACELLVEALQINNVNIEISLSALIHVAISLLRSNTLASYKEIKDALVSAVDGFKQSEKAELNAQDYLD